MRREEREQRLQQYRLISMIVLGNSIELPAVRRGRHRCHRQGGSILAKIFAGDAISVSRDNWLTWIYFGNGRGSSNVAMFIVKARDEVSRIKNSERAGKANLAAFLCGRFQGPDQDSGVGNSVEFASGRVGNHSVSKLQLSLGRSRHIGLLSSASR